MVVAGPRNQILPRHASPALALTFRRVPAAPTLAAPCRPPIRVLPSAPMRWEYQV